MTSNTQPWYAGLFPIWAGIFKEILKIGWKLGPEFPKVQWYGRRHWAVAAELLRCMKGYPELLFVYELLLQSSFWQWEIIIYYPGKNAGLAFTSHAGPVLKYLSDTAYWILVWQRL